MSIPRFRVWDPDSQRMMDIEDWAWTIDMIEANLHADTESPVEEPHIHPWVMFTDMIEEGGGKMLQWSGLFSDDERAVHLGDIIEAKLSIVNMKFTGEVIFEEGYFGLKVPGNPETVPLYGATSIEIKGNVYQNPELLK